MKLTQYSLKDYAADAKMMHARAFDLGLKAVDGSPASITMMFELIAAMFGEKDYHQFTSKVKGVEAAKNAPEDLMTAVKRELARLNIGIFIKGPGFSWASPYVELDYIADTPEQALSLAIAAVAAPTALVVVNKNPEDFLMPSALTEETLLSLRDQVSLRLAADTAAAMKFEETWRNATHPVYTSSDWRLARHSTRRVAGAPVYDYAQWVAHKIEANGGEDAHCTHCGMVAPKADLHKNAQLCRECVEAASTRGDVLFDLTSFQAFSRNISLRLRQNPMMVECFARALELPIVAGLSSDEVEKLNLNSDSFDLWFKCTQIAIAKKYLEENPQVNLLSESKAPQFVPLNSDTITVIYTGVIDGDSKESTTSILVSISDLEVCGLFKSDRKFAD